MTTSPPRLEGSAERSRSARPLGVALAATGIGIAAFALATALPPSTVPTAFSPEWWPQVLSAALVALGVGSAVATLWIAPNRIADDTAPSDTVDERWSLVRLSAVLGATLLYILAWQLIGYAVATGMYTVGLCALLGARGWRGLALFPAIVTVALVAFFDTLLGVPL